jgi:hypothetical protein
MRKAGPPSLMLNATGPWQTPNATSTEYCWFDPFLPPELPSPLPPLPPPLPEKPQNSRRFTVTRCVPKTRCSGLPAWLLHVNPFKPPTRGRDVVVYKKDKAALIKQFVGWERDALVLRQLNPAQELRIPRDDVAECHLVVGVDQEG